MLLCRRVVTPRVEQQICRAFSSLRQRQRDGRGFTNQQYGVEWYSSKDALMASGPGSVLVSSSYSFETANGLKNAMKFGSFDNHFDYWKTVVDHESNYQMHSLHEVIPADRPRSLYFDIDGDPAYRDLHHEIINWLQLYVRWVFSGDRLDWKASDPEPVVLASENPSKYSCHVVFPQIQFADHAEQSLYMKVLLTALAKLEVELEGGIRVPVLERVVDCVPYNTFQNFRGPYACKMKEGKLRSETQLMPELEGFLGSDERTCFAGYTNIDHKLEIPPVEDLLEWNPELRQYYEQYANRVRATGADGSSMQDVALYETFFQENRGGGGMIDFAGCPDLEMYEEALTWLHPRRAVEWWSWFRISGVTFSMLETYGRDPQARARIWNAHHKWSSQYAHFNAEENVERVEKSVGRRVSGLALLVRLVRFDNPGMEVRAKHARIFTHREALKDTPKLDLERIPQIGQEDALWTPSPWKPLEFPDRRDISVSTESLSESREQHGFVTLPLIESMQEIRPAVSV